MLKLFGLAGLAASHGGDSGHKYKAEFNPPDDTFPKERLNAEVLIPKGKLEF